MVVVVVVVVIVVAKGVVVVAAVGIPVTCAHVSRVTLLLPVLLLCRRRRVC